MGEISEMACLRAALWVLLVAPLAALAADPAGEAALEAELNSDQILPETDKERDAAYGQKYVLTSFASGDCTGKALGKPKAVEGCHNSPTMQDCPTGTWTKAFSCKRTEKKSDDVYSQYWSWGVYDGKFALKQYTDAQDWKATELGKVVGSPGATTCFSSLNDIRHVFLLHDQNTPSCRVETEFGTEEELGENGEKEAYISTQGSFTLTPATMPENAPKDTTILNDENPMVNKVVVPGVNAPALQWPAKKKEKEELGEAKREFGEVSRLAHN